MLDFLLSRFLEVRNFNFFYWIQCFLHFVQYSIYLRKSVFALLSFSRYIRLHLISVQIFRCIQISMLKKEKNKDYLWKREFWSWFNVFEIMLKKKMKKIAVRIYLSRRMYKSWRCSFNFLVISYECREVHVSHDRQRDLSVRDADYKSSASYACQKSWTISSTLTEQ